MSAKHKEKQRQRESRKKLPQQLKETAIRSLYTPPLPLFPSTLPCALPLSSPCSPFPLFLPAACCSSLFIFSTLPAKGKSPPLQVYIFARKGAPLFCAPPRCCCCFVAAAASVSLEKHFIASWPGQRSWGGERGTGQVNCSRFSEFFSFRAGHA